MFSPEAKELITEILEAFSQSTQIPVAMYEVDNNGQVTSAIRSDERLCMPSESETSACHDGGVTASESIVIDRTPVAILQHGEIQSILINHSDSIESKLIRQTLIPILSRIIYKYVVRKEHEARTQRMAFHDLQLRLQAALAQAENIRNDFIDNPQLLEAMEDLLGAIEATGTTLHNLTQGQYLPQEYRFRYHRISKFIDQAVMLCRAEARKKNIELKIDLEQPSGHGTIQASEPHLQEVFNNLLQNAVKYSYRAPIDSPHRFVSIHGRSVKDGYQVVITNYGVGIELDEVNLIFTEGYKGKLTKQEYRTGSGQGLALVKRVIEGHHGYINVISRPLSSVSNEVFRPYLTRFTVWLPFKQPDGKKQ